MMPVTPNVLTRAKADNGASVLLVDDDEHLAAAMSLALESAGYRVHHCLHGREALEHLRVSPLPDLIVLDLLMPEMNGWQFRVEQRREPTLRGIPVVAISGDGSAQAAAIDANAYLPKPVAESELLKAVDALLLENDGAAPDGQEPATLSPRPLSCAVVHDINNHLTGVIGNLDLADRRSRNLASTLDDAGQAQLRAVRQLIEKAVNGAQDIAGIVCGVSWPGSNAATQALQALPERPRPRASRAARKAGHLARRPRILAVEGCGAPCCVIR